MNNQLPMGEPPTPYYPSTPGLPPSYQPYTVQELHTLQRGFAILEQHSRENRHSLNSRSHTTQFLRLMLGHETKEVFVAVWLDGQNRYLHTDRLFTGSISSCKIYTRGVIQAALRCNAASVIFAHNHPSGRLIPSEQDKAWHHILEQAMKWIEVRIVDNVIVSPTGVRSITMKN